MQLPSPAPSGGEPLAKRKMGLWSSLILIVVAGLAGYFIGRGNPSGAPEEPAMAEKESGETMERSEAGSLVTIRENTGGSQLLGTAANLVQARDQVAGSSVTLDQVVLKNEGWVAIHDSENGAAGRILGATLTAAGTQTSVAVPLIRATETGKTYIAMIHASNGDREFQFRENEADAPVKDADGKPVMASFKAL